MPTQSSCVDVSADGQYVFASGTYKPRVRCFDVGELAMKFERHLTSEVVKFKILSEDYSKLVFLHADRTVELHARYGGHYKVRVPKCGRDLVYHYPSCDLYVAGSSPEIYRLNLDQGQFLKPLQLENARAVNAIALNPLHGLLCAGTDQGWVECFDPRSRDRCGALDVASRMPPGTIDAGILPEVTAVTSFQNGLTMAVGTSTGQVLMYDIRSSRPLLVKDHNYDLPIKKVVEHPDSGMVLSADSKVVKVWEWPTGEHSTTIETAADINDLCVVPGTGLMFMANESPKIFSYFLPSLGPAPKWCSYLDSITEEMEISDKPTMYDDYKFLTRDELGSLNLTHLIGTNLLRAYMHGFFIDAKLYTEAKSIAEPFAYEEYRKEKLEKMLEEGTAKRIQLKKAARDLPKINRQLAQRMLSEKPDTRGGKKKKANNPLGDDRFKAMFEDEDFEVDVESEQFKLLHPSEKYKQRTDLLENLASDKFTVVDSEDSDEAEGRPSDQEHSSDDDEAPSKPRKSRQKISGKTAKGAFLELQPGESHAPGTSHVGLLKKRASSKSFAQRLDSKERVPKLEVNATGGGTKEAVFSVSKQRRGVKQLGLSKVEKGKYYKGKPV